MATTFQDRFAAEAEKHEGVPFVEHGRDPKVGLDCAGLLIVAAREAGLFVEDLRYVTVPGSDYWNPMVRVVESVAGRMEGMEDTPELWARGDVLGSRFGAMRNHLAVYLGDGWMVHASDATGIRRVVKVPMDPAHKRLVKAVWRLR